MPTTTFCTMQIGINALTGVCDLMIVPTGNGRGRIAVDRTPVSSLLIALGSDRRADTDDVIPELLTAPAGTEGGLFSRRGWPGDVLLPDGQRLGNRFWLYERGKQDETTRQDVENAAAEAVEPIADYHGIEIDASAAWGTQRGLLNVTVSAQDYGVSAQVQTL
ncbi:phage GP46 family protein [Gluconobacter japonicus]|uniref:phage GP46 family protein n=1 Tax=Gluconobacter japonicus TaxID=376620 RepID=UPI0039E8B377